MRLHRDGYIQASKFECRLNLERWNRAINCSKYRNKGIEQQVEEALGVEIDGALRLRGYTDFECNHVAVTIESDWVRPTRS